MINLPRDPKRNILFFICTVFSIFSFAQDNIAVYGKSNAGTSTSFNCGVYGSAEGALPFNTSYGVYGTCDDINIDFAGFFDGDVDVTGFFFGVSDKNLKREINDMDSTIETIMDLRPVTFYYRNNNYLNLNTDRLNYGFVAQEVAEIMPSIVKESSMPNKEYNLAEQNENFTFNSMSYVALIPILTKGIQEQQLIIDEQSKAIISQQKEIDLIKLELKQLLEKYSELE